MCQLKLVNVKMNQLITTVHEEAITMGKQKNFLL